MRSNFINYNEISYNIVFANHSGFVSGAEPSSVAEFGEGDWSGR